ncbi:MAG: tetratricopeptide repeat protein [Anaerolineae bacterium]
MAEHAHPSKSFFQSENYNRVIAMVIASVTLLATLVGFLEHDAAVHSAAARRDAIRYAIQAMGARSSGTTRVGYDRSDAYRAWASLDLQATLADRANDPAALRRYQAVRDRVAKLSPLLAAPYFAPDAAFPNVSAYEADTYLVSSTTLSEQFTDQAETDELWVKKGDTYILHLSLLAAALALLGLSMAMSRRIRIIFMVTGLILVGVTSVWIVQNYLQPIAPLPDSAIEAYAKGVGLAYQNKNQEAIAEFDKAVAQAPEYGNALYERGNAYYALAQYDEAVSNYQEAIAAHKDDTSVNWNLGWTLYVLGQFDAALAVDNHALALDPGIVAIHTNKALALLAAGQMDAARSEYAGTLDLAARQVADAKAAGQEPPTELWAELDSGAGDLENLVGRLNGQAGSQTEAPPRETVANASAVIAEAQQQAQRIKEMDVALEYTGRAPGAPVSAQIQPLQFGAPAAVGSTDNVYSDTLPAGPSQVVVRVDYDGMQNGQSVLWKVYVDGVEDEALRVAGQWSQGAKGSTVQTFQYAGGDIFTFSSGEYVVEMYVDSHLVQRGRFTVSK